MIMVHVSPRKPLWTRVTTEEKGKIVNLETDEEEEELEDLIIEEDKDKGMEEETEAAHPPTKLSVNVPPRKGKAKGPKDPGLKLISQTNPYTTGPLGNIPWSMDWGLTRSIMGGWWNQGSAPLIFLSGWFSPTMNTFMPVTSHTFLACEAFTPCYIRLRAALTRGCGDFALLGQRSVLFPKVAPWVLLIFL